MMNADIKIIFQDVDGCLNPEDGEAFGVAVDWEPSSAQVTMLEAIDAAVDASTLEHFVINTGRPWPLVRNLVKHFKSPKLRYLLLEHACVLYDREQDLFVNCAELAEHYGLSELSTRYRQIEVIQTLFDWYQSRGQAQLEAHYATDLTPVEKLGNLSIVIPEGVDGEEMLARIEALARAQLDEREMDQLDFLRSDRYLDILPGIHKLDGIHLLSAHFGLSLDAAMAVGDYLNDLSVFESFSRVMCPANAHPEIKELAQSKAESGHVSHLSYGAALLELLGAGCVDAG
ncbi:HAD hydrolase family protein [Coraliomargarita algicola]|uniref:HAD hydrolase family protein n=1 Tax=Coraliomargarita algicola TaxID=3092156 RepID=A0ABZ0RJ10_9BACT|nr:HAD hydrolase family protein [Coraliomargarita sp. J2-16]WPJ96191.1 HAD hydrolase family protein [Coraliomargarita sp. J2-16]